MKYLVSGLFLWFSTGVAASEYYIAPYDNLHIGDQLFDDDFLIADSGRLMTAFEFASDFSAHSLLRTYSSHNPSATRTAFARQLEGGYIQLSWDREWGYGVVRSNITTGTLGGATANAESAKYAVIKVTGDVGYFNRDISLYPAMLNLDDYLPFRTADTLNFFDRLSDTDAGMPVSYKIYNANAFDDNCGYRFYGIVTWPLEPQEDNCSAPVNPQPLYTFTVYPQQYVRHTVIPVSVSLLLL